MDFNLRVVPAELCVMCKKNIYIYFPETIRDKKIKIGKKILQP